MAYSNGSRKSSINNIHKKKKQPKEKTMKILQKKRAKKGREVRKSWTTALYLEHRHAYQGGAWGKPGKEL